MQEILGSYEIKAQLNGLMKSDQSPLTLKNMHSKYSPLNDISRMHSLDRHEGESILPEIVKPPAPNFERFQVCQRHKGGNESETRRSQGRINEFASEQQLDSLNSKRLFKYNFYDGKCHLE